MWNFIQGVERPQKKQKTDETEKILTRVKCDRKRTFQWQWTKLFPWVECRDDEKMYCTPCVLKTGISDPSSAFISGCTTFRIDSLKTHHNSAKHKLAATAYNASKELPGTSKSDQLLQTLNKATLEEMKLLFRSAHALALKGRPFTDFAWICDLDRKKGLNIGESYSNDKQCQIFIKYIAENERVHLEKAIQECSFYSIICDGTVDNATEEVMIMYIRYCLNGSIHTKFLSLEQIERGNSENIFKCIKSSLINYGGIPEAELFKKFVGFASDGASVMRGANSGVVAKLKQQQSCIQAIHCVAHRLELSCKEAFNAYPYHKTFQKTLQGVYRFYSRSALNMNNLKTACRALQTKFMKPRRADGTRWITFSLEAVVAIRQLYPALIKHLEQVSVSGHSAEAKGKAKQLFKVITSENFILYLHFLMDILPILSQLSLSYQQSNLSLSEVYYKLHNTLSTLEKLESSPGINFSTILSSKVFHDQQIKLQDYKDFAATSVTIKSLLQSLKNRFDDASVIDSMNFLNFKIWPIKFEGTYGDEEIIKCITTFEAVLRESNCSVESIICEWTNFKQFLYTKYKNVSKCDWNSLKELDNIKNFSLLIDILLSLPTQSADCERGFSAMKRVKNDWRSKLRTVVTTDLIRITLSSTSITDFEPEEAINMWLSAKQRKPYHKLYKSRKLAPLSSEDSDSDNCKEGSCTEDSCTTDDD